MEQNELNVVYEGKPNEVLSLLRLVYLICIYLCSLTFLLAALVCWAFSLVCSLGFLFLWIISFPPTYSFLVRKPLHKLGCFYFFIVIASFFVAILFMAMYSNFPEDVWRVYIKNSHALECPTPAESSDCKPIPKDTMLKIYFDSCDGLYCKTLNNTWVSLFDFTFEGTFDYYLIRHRLQASAGSAKKQPTKDSKKTLAENGSDASLSNISLLDRIKNYFKTKTLREILLGF